MHPPETPRTRRLQRDEGERLEFAAGGLRGIIVAALETGCRRGELFSPRAELFLPAQKTKAKRNRRPRRSIKTAWPLTLERAKTDALRSDLRVARGVLNQSALS